MEIRDWIIGGLVVWNIYNTKWMVSRFGTVMMIIADNLDKLTISQAVKKRIN